MTIPTHPTPPREPETVEAKTLRLKVFIDEADNNAALYAGATQAIDIIDQLLAEREKDKAEIERLESENHDKWLRLRLVVRKSSARRKELAAKDKLLAMAREKLLVIDKISRIGNGGSQAGDFHAIHKEAKETLAALSQQGTGSGYPTLSKTETVHPAKGDEHEFCSKSN